MLSLIIIILFVLFFVRRVVTSYREPYFILDYKNKFCIFIWCILFLGWLCCVVDVSTSHVIDKKIKLYEDENTHIEQNTSLIVNDFSDLKQFSVYFENTEKIKDLKEAKINLAYKRWLVYFGK